MATKKTTATRKRRDKKNIERVQFIFSQPSTTLS